MARQQIEASLQRDRLTRGNLDAKVSVVEGPGDLATLGQTFNRMTEQLKEQRNELVSANVKPISKNEVPFMMQR